MWYYIEEDMARYWAVKPQKNGGSKGVMLFILMDTNWEKYGFTSFLLILSNPLTPAAAWTHDEANSAY